VIDMEIQVQELHQRLATGEDIQLVDVREGWEFALAYIPGALLVPMSELETRLKDLDKQKPTIVYCHHGIRSLHAALALRSRGFENARSLRGGIDRWSVEIDPTLPRY
jgi:rhodanese-related sulfurtransferase